MTIRGYSVRRAITGRILSALVASGYVSWAGRDSIAGMGEQPDLILPRPLSVWKRLLLPALLAVLVVPAFWLDMSLSHFFAAKPWGGDLAKMVMLCEAFGYAGTAALIMLAAALLDPRGWRVLPRLVIVSFGAGLLADLIKLLVGRHRPLDEKFVAESALQSFTTWDAHQHVHLTQSFPSAHTATATGLACGLAFFYPRGTWLFIVLAMLTALQRMHAREHYLSDVFAGAAVGTLVGIVTTSRLPSNRWLDRLENKPATDSTKVNKAAVKE
ncbi:MAG: phosphatase PAP2 family protein [Pirellulaceae bacterium]|nr:phosphatase PAP2 family protein [Pirellulaceae bacterium]